MRHANRFTLQSCEVELLRSLGESGWSYVKVQEKRVRAGTRRGELFFAAGTLCFQGSDSIFVGAEAGDTTRRTEIFRICSFRLSEERRQLFRPPLKPLLRMPLAETVSEIGEFVEAITVLSVQESSEDWVPWLIDEGVLFQGRSRRLLVTASSDLPLDIDLTVDDEAIRRYLRGVASARCVFHR